MCERREDDEENDEDDEELRRRSHSRRLLVLPPLSTTIECLILFFCSLPLLAEMDLWTLVKGGSGGWEGWKEKSLETSPLTFLCLKAKMKGETREYKRERMRRMGLAQLGRKGMRKGREEYR